MAPPFRPLLPRRCVSIRRTREPWCAKIAPPLLNWLRLFSKRVQYVTKYPCSLTRTAVFSDPESLTPSSVREACSSTTKCVCGQSMMHRELPQGFRTSCDGSHINSTWFSTTYGSVGHADPEILKDTRRRSRRSIRFVLSSRPSY